ncbi:MAG: transporter [Haloferacaceae archaeon]
MALALTLAYVVHVVVAALWTGSVLFVTYAVLPQGYDGTIGPDALSAAVGKLSVLTRTAALVLPITGGYQILRLYPGEAILTPPRGHLVLGMVVLWLAVTALVEVAGARMREGLDREKVRTPAREGRPFLLAASLLSLLLLVDAGLLAAGFGA